MFVFSDDDTSASNYYVIAGNHRQDSTETNEKRYNIKSITLYPHWDTYDLSGDIALLELTENVVYNDHVQPACLREHSFDPGWMCTVTGWGDTLGRQTV